MWSFFLILSFEPVNKLLSRVRAVFLSAVMAKQSNYSDQLQQTQTTQWTNQKDKQIHVTDAKHETISSMSGLVWSHFWFVEKVVFFYQPQSKVRQNQSKCKLLSTVNWKLLYSGLDFSTVKHAFTPYLCSWVSINLHVPEFFSLTLSSEVLKWNNC